LKGATAAIKAFIGLKGHMANMSRTEEEEKEQVKTMSAGDKKRLKK